MELCNSLVEKQDKTAVIKPFFFPSSLPFPMLLANCKLHCWYFLLFFVCEVFLKYQLIVWLDEPEAGLYASWKLCLSSRRSLCLEGAIKYSVPCSSFRLLLGNSVAPSTRCEPHSAFFHGQASIQRVKKNYRKRNMIVQKSFILLLFLFINLLVCNVIQRLTDLCFVF